MIPGPTNVDPKILRALSKPTLSHTDPKFVEIYNMAIENLKRVFVTRSDVFVVAGSGTLALEMAVSNIVKPGDKVLNVVIGFFGNYFVKISEAHGAISKVMEFPWGKCARAESIKEALEEDDYRAVTVTHVDTSTGVVNPVKEIGEVVSRHSDAFYVVDTVCSLGGIEVRVDDWNIDLCASGSQKCIGTPPGLAFLSASERVLEYLENTKTNVSFWYGDIRNWLPIMRDPSGYFATPAVNMVYALSEALEAILVEGLEQRYRRHHIMAEAFRSATNVLNMRLVADRACVADTLTASYYPDGIDDIAFRKEMKKRGVVVAAALGPIRGKGVRVGHMGNVDQNDILSTIGAIEGTLAQLGHKFQSGVGLSAAEEKIGSMQRLR